MKNEETGWFLHQQNSALASLAEYKEVKIQPLEVLRVTGALIAEGCAAASLLSVLCSEPVPHCPCRMAELCCSSPGDGSGSSTGMQWLS